MLTLHTEFPLHHYTVGSYNIVCSELHPCEFNQSYSRNYPHTHDSFEACFVQSGSGLYIENQIEYVIKKNCLFLGHPYVNHEIILTSEAPLRLYYCNFIITHTDRVSSVSEEESIINLFLKSSLSIVPKCRHLNSFLPMFTSYVENGGFFSSKKALEALLIEMMLALTPQSIYTHNEHITFKSKISQYINLHLNEKISVDMLAKFMNVSPRTLFYLFKKHFNTTPIQYINYAKISSSILYLRMGFSITQVSNLFGFSELSSFSRTFKKYTGLSPHEYLTKK